MTVGQILNFPFLTGYEREWSTNLDYAQARMYNHNRARFMQPDPLGLGASDLSAPQTLNSYSYVGNDPVNFVDPTGTDIIAITSCVTIRAEGEIVGIDCETKYYITSGGPFSIGGGGGGGIGVIGGGGGAQSKGAESPKAKPCPPSLGLGASLEINGSAFAGFGAGTSVTGSAGVFYGFPGANPRKYQAVAGAYGSGGALFLNHSAPNLPRESDPLRPSTGQGYVMGAGAGV